MGEGRGSLRWPTGQRRAETYLSLLPSPRGGRNGVTGMRVEQVRGGVVEAVHAVHVAVVDGAGALVAGTGDPELVTFWRSAAKPFQALPLVEDGVVERFGLTTEDLALVCASHSSEPGQVARTSASSSVVSPNR